MCETVRPSAPRRARPRPGRAAAPAYWWECSHPCAPARAWQVAIATQSPLPPSPCGTCRPGEHGPARAMPAAVPPAERRPVALAQPQPGERTPAADIAKVSKSKPAAIGGEALAMLSLAPAGALAFLAAGLTLALAGGGYYLAALAILPALGLALAIRGAAAGGWGGNHPPRPKTRMDRAAAAIGWAGLAILAGCTLLAMLWR